MKPIISAYEIKEMRRYFKTIEKDIKSLPMLAQHYISIILADLERHIEEKK